MKTGIIYIATNTINNKSYIGKTTKSLNERIIEHKNGSKYYDRPFYSAINKYGFDAFSWKTLYNNVDISMLDLAEICAIYSYDTFAQYGNGYNATTGGDGCITFDDTTLKKMSNAQKGERNHNYGKPCSVETKEKISKSLKGRKYTKEHRQNLSKARVGRVVSEETREKLSIASTGRKQSEESKKKKSISNKGQGLGKKLPEKTILKMKESRAKYLARKKLEESKF